MPAQHRLYRRLWRWARWFPRPASPSIRRAYCGLVGGAIVMAGVIMIILPGPALVVIPLGLLVLASEFLIIRRWIRTARKSFLSRNKTRGGTFSPLADTANN